MTKLVNTQFPEQLVKDMDKVASNEQRTRASLIRQAVRLYLSRRGFPQYASATPGEPGGSTNKNTNPRSN